MNVVRTTLGAGVDGPPPHFHKQSPEMFYLLEGALRILAGDQVLTGTKGDYPLVSQLMHHAWGTPLDIGADVEASDLPARRNPPSRGDWLGDCPRVVDLG